MTGVITSVMGMNMLVDAGERERRSLVTANKTRQAPSRSFIDYFAITTPSHSKIIRWIPF